MKNAFLLFLLIFGQKLLASNIKGTIKNTKGEAMPYTSVIVKGTSKGIMANANGEYIIALQSGSYELVFQFLGYQSLTKSISIDQKDIELNVVLEEQTINLGEVKVGGGEEDPAYTIMRKAIAKSKIHHLQITSYQANAYIKSTILVNSIPFFVRKDLEKEGIKVGVPFISESILEFTFKQPNNRFSRVIAKKSSSIENNISVADGFYLIDFYNPVMGNQIISPLSPSAFSYYRFEYEGFFEDRGVTVNKIRVIPKNYGPGVWQGTIFIIENYWNIHSINVETVNNGFTTKIYQVYSPIQQVWMPVNQRLEFSGKVLGFDFYVKSQVNPAYKSVVTNPVFVEEIKLIDEKKEGKKANSLSKEDFKKKSSTDIMATQKEFSLKELNRLLKEREKEERQRRKENHEDVRVVRNDSVVVDSMATKRTSEFWESARTIPLTTQEAKGYHFSDSLKVVRIEKKDSLRQDSLRKNWQKFVFGHDFKLKNGSFLKYEPPYTPLVGLNYNTVEGITANLGLTLHRDFDPKKPNLWQYKISSDVRYGFGLQRLMARVESDFKHEANEFSVGGGRYKAQFDAKSGMFDYLNTITTLFGLNIAKIYQKDYIHVGYAYEKDKRLRFSTDLEFANRTELNNLPSNKLLFQSEKTPFTSNSPTNIELGTTDFPTHNALIWNSYLTWKPGLRYRIYNGRKIFFGGDLPNFTISYRKGMADVDYDFLSLKVVQKVRTGWAGTLNYYVEVGDFLNSNKLYLMDLQHLNSINLTNVGAIPENIFAHYRLLNTTSPIQISADNYYKFSTKGAFLKAHVINEFKSLLITQIPAARLYGLKEDIFVNYLNSPTKKNYVEIGYGIDGIFRLWRLEAITSFEDGKYQRWGWQIGVTF